MNVRSRSIAFLGFLTLTLLAGAVGCAQSEGEASIRQHYRKAEYRVPMRDGTKLHTVVYAPRDTSRTYPFLMMRTPYGCRPYGETKYPKRLGLNPQLTKRGYIYVAQDVRGTHMSEGKFENMRAHLTIKRGPHDVDESTDTYDTIEWLINNIDNNNNRVGQWGISYPGFYSAAGMIDAHPALRAVSPQAPIADWWYDDFHHHGAFFLAHAYRFLAVFGHEREGLTESHFRSYDFPTPDGYDFYYKLGSLRDVGAKHLTDNPLWNAMVDHPTYDAYWQARNILPHLNNVAPAVLTIGGWFDAEDLYGPLMIYQSTEAKNPDVDNTIVMGPWVHGGWSRTDGDKLGDIEFGGKTSAFYQNEIEVPFFEHHLKDGPAPNLAEATMFDTGSNTWQRFDDWPPANARAQSIYVADNDRLRMNAAPTASDNTFDSFVSDPAKPVPFTEQISNRMPREYMTEDQRFASRRPDVLTYQTEPLTAPITLAGPLTAELWVSTSESDADWIVKLIDVLPDDTPLPVEEDRNAWPKRKPLGGYQMMVRSEVIRGRFRNSHSLPEPFTPNQPTLVKLPLQDVLHTFKPGHRIMIQIQSTWFPLVDRNPQRYVPNIFEASLADFVKATHRVYRSSQYPTRLEVRVLGIQDRVANGDLSMNRN